MTDQVTEQPSAAQAEDERFMRLALTLGRRGLGQTWPNPTVGAVIVKNGVIVGRGWTQPGGRPHAESEALRRAKRAANGATMYVTLEPCSHEGKTPPCADAIIKAGIKRVVSALEDPNPEVAGQGHARLRDKGIQVDVGLFAAEAGRVHAGHIDRITKGRPNVGGPCGRKARLPNVYRDPEGYPEWQARGLPVECAPTGLAQTAQESKAPGPLYGWAMIWTLLGIFAGGMALNLTPCVYPMIPITVSYFGGRATAGEPKKGQLAVHGLLYLLGLAFTNSILGVMAALTGSLMGAMLQHTAVLIGLPPS